MLTKNLDTAEAGRDTSMNFFMACSQLPVSSTGSTVYIGSGRNERRESTASLTSAPSSPSQQWKTGVAMNSQRSDLQAQFRF